MSEIGQVKAILGRQMRGKHLWYEVEKVGRRKSDSPFRPNPLHGFVPFH